MERRGDVGKTRVAKTSPETATDLADLIAQVSRGDQTAFQQLYERTSAKLFGVVLRIVKGRELADEVLQDSYLRIWQNAARYVPDSGRPMTWMIAIARYAAIDVVRKRSQDANYTPIDPPEPPASPERQVVVQDMLGRCLGRLAAPQLECVVLAYCNGYSREELARHFSAQIPTIKTWLHRALNALRLCLETP
ncbi:MAG: sigma-70 family RNA polymerase sigma factor [Pseudomonadota bacterium]|nr:sigma-70 family RNA polymerase sigma factor [Pseudomonadota bacterium]